MDDKQILINIVEKQDLASLKTFIANNENFSLTFTTDKGRNLLHYAASKLSSNTLSIIQLLLQKGLDPLSVDENFESALDTAKAANNVPAMTLMKHSINKRIQEEQTHF